jgi:ABC-2 type transport system permease protein
MPMRYFLVVVRGIFLKGIGVRELWHQGAALVGLGAVILTVAVTRFRKRLG